MIVKRTAFECKCNNCDNIWTDPETERRFFIDRTMMEDTIMESGWYSWRNKQYCPDCFSFDSDDRLVVKTLNNDIIKG